MSKVISFCIYGSDVKYYEGLMKNLQIIEREMPDVVTWIYVGNCVHERYLAEYKKFNTKLINVTSIKACRCYPIDDPSVEIMFSRDADSRINSRDLWCMKEFIKSDKKFHIIRDNYWHKSRRILAGTFGVKKGLININLQKECEQRSYTSTYGDDERFLEEIVYPLIKNDLLVHSDIIAYGDEPYPQPINIHNNGTNFVGNVYNEEDIPMFNFWDQLNKNIIEHVDWHVAQKTWPMIIQIISYLNYDKLDARVRYNIYDKLYMAYYYINNIEGCRNTLKYFKNCHIDEHIINNSNFLFGRLGKKIIATTDVNRSVKDDEILIIYGNYHHSVDGLPHSNIVKRHAIYYHMIKHDIFESHKCWDNIGKIYILNLEERIDRYMEICVELTRINAPLNRIHHYKAQKESIVGNRNVDPHLGALKNHLDVVHDFLLSDNKYCLILEDDVTFTSDIATHQKDLSTFFEREYDFDVTLITSSKYWEIKPHDDLLSLSYQICTTSSGYILSREGAKKIYPIFAKSYELMKQTLDTLNYAVDRCWSSIQKDNKFFVFNNKFGYQRCNYSSITGKTECHFD